MDQQVERDAEYSEGTTCSPEDGRAGICLFVCSCTVTVASACAQEETLALRKEGIGVVLDSELPHLIGIDDDLLSTGIILYHLKVRSQPEHLTAPLGQQHLFICLFVFVSRPQEGKTYVGREDAATEQDISE